MHRNTYLNSPKILKPTYQTKAREDLFIAGQLTGVEGYVESAASGLVAGRNMALWIKGEEVQTYPKTTMIGALAHYISHPLTTHFQPMNANFGLIQEMKISKKFKKQAYFDRAMKELSYVL